MANLSDIERLGWCNDCKEWIPLEKGKDWLPDHNEPEEEKCGGSRYSYWGLKYHIRTPDEAIAVAKWIKNDEGGCLSPHNSIGLHSLACGDGRHCEETRLRWAKALAEYFLAHNS